jgi:hypothetical protein
MISPPAVLVPIENRKWGPLGERNSNKVGSYDDFGVSVYMYVQFCNGDTVVAREGCLDNGGGIPRGAF